MQRCWLDFCKEHDYTQDTNLTDFGDTRKLDEWFEWVGKNYHDPLPVASPWDN